MAKSKSNAIDQQKKEIISTLHKRFLGELLIALALLGGVVGLSLNDIKKRLEDITVNRIAKQFEEPRINSLIEDVAQNEANNILQAEVHPEVKKFKNEINLQLDEFDQFLKKLKQQYEQDYKTLSSEVELLQKRNHYASLGDAGISHASRDALEELKRLKTEIEEQQLLDSINSEIYRIKSYWATMTTIKGEKLTREGEEISSDELSTDELINHLLNNPNWKVRALIARDLRNRNEKKVPDALITCIKDEKNLEVIKYASDSFSKITGYKCPDVFGFKLIPQWWSENSEQVLEKLKESE